MVIDKTGEELYKKMVTEGMSLVWIEREYGVNKHYIIKKVYNYMQRMSNERR